MAVVNIHWHVQMGKAMNGNGNKARSLFIVRGTDCLWILDGRVLWPLQRLDVNLERKAPLELQVRWIHHATRRDPWAFSGNLGSFAVRAVVSCSIGSYLRRHRSIFGNLSITWILGSISNPGRLVLLIDKYEKRVSLLRGM